MRAAVYYGKLDLRLEQVADPAPKPDNMVARVECCAICGTDIKTYTVGNPKFVPPIILGHELVAQITHVGERVAGFSPGEYVTLATTIPCGTCAYCGLGLGNLCLNAKPISSHYNGAFADYIEIPPDAIRQNCVVKLPLGGNMRRYAICEPLSCAVNAHEIVDVRPGETVVIIGGGPLGAIHAELAKAEGAARVYVVDISDSRLELMRRLSGITLVNGGTQDVAAVVREGTHGLGADVVFVCAPAPSAFEQAPDYVRKGGRISYFASLPVQSALLHIDSRPIHYNELRVAGVSDSRVEHVHRAAQLIGSGAIDCDAIITDSVSLEDIGKGIDMMRERKSLKVVVCPGGV